MKRLLLFWILPIIVIGYLHWAVDCNFDCQFDDNGVMKSFDTFGQWLEAFIMGLVGAGILNLALWAGAKLQRKVREKDAVTRRKTD